MVRHNLGHSNLYIRPTVYAIHKAFWEQILNIIKDDTKCQKVSNLAQLNWLYLKYKYIKDFNLGLLNNRARNFLTSYVQLSSKLSCNICKLGWAQWNLSSFEFKFDDSRLFSYIRIRLLRLKKFCCTWESKNLLFDMP